MTKVKFGGEKTQKLDCVRRRGTMQHHGSGDGLLTGFVGRGT